MKRIFILIVIMAIGLGYQLQSVMAKKKWYIIKTKNGVCRVISADGKTDQTIGGPYKSEKNARSAKKKVCETRDLPSKKKKSKSKTSSDKKKKSETKGKKKSSEPESLEELGVSVIKDAIIDMIRKMEF